jgi:hypothetical protein
MLNFQDYSSKGEMLSLLWILGRHLAMFQGKISVLFGLRAHSYKEELNISLTSLNSLQTRKGKKGRNNKSSIHLDKHECKKQEEEHLIKKIYTN